MGGVSPSWAEGSGVMEDVTSEMSTPELLDWLTDIEMTAQDAWDDSETARLRAEHNMVRTALQERGVYL
jgi:hypothetical protein